MFHQESAHIHIFAKQCASEKPQLKARGCSVSIVQYRGEELQMHSSDGKNRYAVYKKLATGLLLFFSPCLRPFNCCTSSI